MVKSDGTEQKILDAAREVFIRKGLHGARMQEIANEAGINKALLHYYFRSKEKLFDKIFEEAFHTILIGLDDIFAGENPIEQKLKQFIDLYIDVLMENPYLPLFILTEINQNPERLEKIIEQKAISSVPNFIMQIMNEISKGNIRPVHPLHLFINLMGMMVFPFAARPLMSRLLKKNLSIDFDDVLAERKEVVYQFMIDAIMIKKPENES